MKVTDEQIAQYFEVLDGIFFDQMNGMLLPSDSCPACIFAHVAKLYGLEMIGVSGIAFFHYEDGFKAYCDDRGMSKDDCCSLFLSHSLSVPPHGGNQWNVPVAKVFRAIADAKYPRN